VFLIIRRPYTNFLTRSSAYLPTLPILLILPILLLYLFMPTCLYLPIYTYLSVPTYLCLPIYTYLSMPTCLYLLIVPTYRAYLSCLPIVPTYRAYLSCLPIVPTYLCLPIYIYNLGERSAQSKALLNSIAINYINSNRSLCVMGSYKCFWTEACRLLLYKNTKLRRRRRRRLSETDEI